MEALVLATFFDDGYARRGACSTRQAAAPVAYFGSKKSARTAVPPIFSVACSSHPRHIDVFAGHSIPEFRQKASTTQLVHAASA
jgi:hypothetical protein